MILKLPYSRLAHYHRKQTLSHAHSDAANMWRYAPVLISSVPIRLSVLSIIYTDHMHKHLVLNNATLLIGPLHYASSLLNSIPYNDDLHTDLSTSGLDENLHFPYH